MKLPERLINAFLLHGGSLLGIYFRHDWLKKAHRSRTASERKLLRQLRRNAGTEYGKIHHFDSIRSVRDYQDQVPLSVYEDYEPYIQRMITNGETNLITSSRIRFYASTSGTVGITKLIPHCAASYLPYFKWLCICSNDIVRSMKKRSLSSFNARGIQLTEISSEPLPDSYGGKNSENKVSIGGVSSYAVGGIRLFMPIVTQLPGVTINNPEIKDLQYIKARYALQDPNLTFFCGVFASVLYDFMNYLQDNRELLIKDIEQGTIDPSVDLGEKTRKILEGRLKADPIRASQLREAFDGSENLPLVNRIWKNMSFVFSIGTGDFEPFTRKMRSYCSKDVSFGYVLYSASEAFMGCAMDLEEPYYLLVNDDAFFEFLPVDEPCQRPLLMHELKPGALYEMIVTNISGLYRYQLKDVIRVIGFEGESPYVQFAYRANRVANLNGCHITGTHVDVVIAKLEEETGRNIVEYSTFIDYEVQNPRIELFVEGEEDFSAEASRQLSDIAEKAFLKDVFYYENERLENHIAPCMVHVLKRGTYAAYRRKRVAEGSSLNQLKSPRVLRAGEQVEFFRNAVVKPEQL